MARKNVLLFLLLAMLWGGSFVAIKLAVRVFPPSFSAMLRALVALACLSALFLYQRANLSAPAPARRRMWLAGVFSQGLPFALLFWGEQRISPGLAGIINGTVPLWTFLLGLCLSTGEPLTRRRAAGLLLGFAGIAVICSPLLTFTGTRAEAAGMAAVFLMAMSYAAGALLSRGLLSKTKVDLRANTFHQQCASLAFLVAASLLMENWPPPAQLFASPPAVASILYLGVGSTALAFLIFFHLIREWGAVRASAVTYVAPIFAVFWDYVFFSNAPTEAQALGTLAIFSGLLLLHFG